MFELKSVRFLDLVRVVRLKARSSAIVTKIRFPFIAPKMLHLINNDTWHNDASAALTLPGEYPKYLADGT